MDFDEWMDAVDQVICDRTGFLSSDLPDQPWRDWFDDGIGSDEAAQTALEEEVSA